VRNASVVVALLSVALFMYGNDYPGLPVFRSPSRRPCLLTHTSWNWTANLSTQVSILCNCIASTKSLLQFTVVM